MNEPSLKQVLGTTKKIEEPHPEPFYKALQHFVDSKEKATTSEIKKKKEKGEKTQMEFWPLIKVVRIYTKAYALSTGAVIVDLPGVHDSNAARAAVASGYMKQCTGLWIVAPINRAVDDKAAKSLLVNPSSGNSSTMALIPGSHLFALRLMISLSWRLLKVWDFKKKWPRIGRRLIKSKKKRES
jgi:hypothetical protein